MHIYIYIYILIINREKKHNNPNDKHSLLTINIEDKAYI